MKITGLSQTTILEAAARTFTGKYFDLEEGSLFLRGAQPGAYHCEGVEGIQYVSTSMGYHEEIINGNRTRVKTMIPLLFVKDERYEVVYEGAKRCYVPVEDEGEITFMSYPQFLTWIMEKVRPAVEETAG